jgi:hypothetical protein
MRCPCRVATHALAPPVGILSSDGTGFATPASSSDMPLMAVPLLMAATVAQSSPTDAESAAGPLCLPVLATIGAVNGLRILCSSVLRSPWTTIWAMHDAEPAFDAHEQSPKSDHRSTPCSFTASSSPTAWKERGNRSVVRR